MSKFTSFRDSFENFLSSAFHKGVAVLEPIAESVGHAVTPLVEAALVTAGKAVVEAHSNGTAHDSDEMVGVALKSLRTAVPELTASVSTALAAAVVQQHAQEAVQATDAPLNVPPVVGA